MVIVVPAFGSSRAYEFAGADTFPPPTTSPQTRDGIGIDPAASYIIPRVEFR